MSGRKPDNGPGKGTGYYANPQSPIASTPQRRPKGGPTESPASSTLSPMHNVSGVPLRREDEETWTQALFSPVLKFIGATSESDESQESIEDARTVPQQQQQQQQGTGAPSLARLPSPGGTTTTGVGVTTFSYSSVDTSTLRSPSGKVVAETVARFGGSGVIAVETGDTDVYGGVDEGGGGGGGGGGSGGMHNHGSAVSPSTSASTESEDYEYELEEFNPYLFMKMLPEYSSVAPPVPRICLPKKDPTAPPITLVLDLDETLVHCSVEPIPGADLTFPVDFNGTNYTVFVRKRPHLTRFLEAIWNKFEVVVFTASQKVYADKLLNLIDPEGRYFKYRLFRDACLNVDGNFLKDLSVLGRDLRTAVLVDNSPHAFGYQIDNGIPIESWFEDPTDTELLKLAAFLETIQSVPDVRPALRRKFNVRAMVDRCVPPF